MNDDVRSVLFFVDNFRILQSSVFTVENGDRDDVMNIALILTDGQSDDSTASFQAASDIHAANVASLITIGVDVKGKYARYVNLLTFKHSYRSFHLTCSRFIAYLISESLSCLT